MLLCINYKSIRVKYIQLHERKYIMRAACNNNSVFMSIQKAFKVSLPPLTVANIMGKPIIQTHIVNISSVRCYSHTARDHHY